MDTLSYLLGKKSSGGGGDLNWSAIGYSGTPQSIVDGYNYAKYIQDNWQEDTSRLYDFQDVMISPLVSLGNRTSMYYFGASCSKLVEVPLLDTSNITNMSSAFYSASVLLTVPLFDTSKVTNMEQVFTYCYQLTSIPLFNTSNVTNMYSMFKGCKNLTTVPLLNTSNVTSMGSMFSGCSSLKSVPLFDTSNVTNMGDMFGGCSKLTDIPLFNTSKVTGFYAFINNDTKKLTDESLDNILQMCINATSYTGTKTLYQLGFRSNPYPTTKIQALPHYQDFIDAGWTIGY